MVTVARVLTSSKGYKILCDKEEERRKKRKKRMKGLKSRKKGIK